MFNIDFEICALVFLLIIMVHFFSKYHLLTVQNAFFAFLMVVGAADIVMDIVTAYMIDYSDIVPRDLTVWVTTIFYALQVLLPVMLFLFVLSVLHLNKPANRRGIALFIIPAAIFVCWVLSNPMSRHFCYFNEQGEYIRGKFFVALYFVCTFYFFLVFLTILKFKKRLRVIEFETILCFLLLLVTGIYIQYLYPTQLLTGVAIAISLTMIYLTLQNPDEMMDELTGLYNRTSMIKYLNSRMDGNGGVHIVLVALDDMKQINNLLGLDNGNAAIYEVSSFIKNHANKAPVFRVIGDQIAIITKEREDCLQLVYDLEQRFKEQWDVGGTYTKLSACICYVLEARERLSANEVVSVMEYMMAQAKKHGHGTVIEVDDAALRKRQRSLEVERAVEDALKYQLFEPYFQPIYDVNAGAFTTLEVLTRLTHPELGVISPMEFIPLAEKKAKIIEVEEQIYNKTFQFIREHNLETNYDLEYIEINLSAVQLMQEDAAERMEQMLKNHHIRPDFVCLEVTETVATKTFSYARRTMKKLIETGIRFAMDDYGTGYANIDSVIQLPFSIVKIDRDMLLSSQENIKCARIFEKTISLMQDLELSVVVEGAETKEQINHLYRIGVDYIQGYYYSKRNSSAFG